MKFFPYKVLKNLLKWAQTGTIPDPDDLDVIVAMRHLMLVSFLRVSVSGAADWIDIRVELSDRRYLFQFYANS